MGFQLREISIKKNTFCKSRLQASQWQAKIKTNKKRSRAMCWYGMDTGISTPEVSSRQWLVAAFWKNVSSVNMCIMCFTVSILCARICLLTWLIGYAMHSSMNHPKVYSATGNSSNRLKVIRPELGGSIWSFSASASTSTNAAPESPPGIKKRNSSGSLHFLGSFCRVTFIYGNFHGNNHQEFINTPTDSNHWIRCQGR